MRPIPLNLMTLYADLLQSVELDDGMPGSIATKTVAKRKYIYATTKDGSARLHRGLSKLDAEIQNCI